jgi:transposase
VIGALALDGIVASRAAAAATGTTVFLAFVEQALVAALRGRPEAVVVMDNLAATRPRRGGPRRRPRRSTTAPALLLPDLSPIEPAWSKLKARLRAVGARSNEALERALGPALATITARDARGWFRLAGYPAAD